MNTFKKLSIAALAALAAIALSTPSRADDPLIGKITVLYADPSDFVMDTTINGPCGSTMFHVKRDAENFKETVTLAVSAFTLDKTVAIYMDPNNCSDDRNIITNIGIY